MKRILFICTGNVFRSYCAELCFNDYAIKHHLDWRAESAGTFEKTQDYVDPALLKALKELGIKATDRRPRKVSKEILGKADMVIAIADYHQAYLKENFGIEAPLFNELIGNHGSVPDIDDVIDGHHEKRDEVENHLWKTARYIHESVPLIAAGLQKR